MKTRLNKAILALPEAITLVLVRSCPYFTLTGFTAIYLVSKFKVRTQWWMLECKNNLIVDGHMTDGGHSTFLKTCNDHFLVR